MLERYELQIPRKVFSGVNSLAMISKILFDNSVKRVAVFTGKTIEKTGLLEAVLSPLRGSGIEITVLNDLPPEPSYTEAQKAVDAFKESKADFIMAVGGGSVLDVAKLASVLGRGETDVYDLLNDPGKAKKTFPSLLIPTTAGTGAEATPNAIVSVPEKKLKVGIVSMEMMADYVILDPRMIRDLPRKIAASTGIDALAHAIECWTSNKANPFSDLFSMQALELILKNIETACDDPDATESKTRMLLASFYAGIAITASGTTAVHALSYPLGGRYHIPHGVSNAILLVPVMRFNRPACTERLAMVYDRCIHADARSDDEKCEAVINRLEAIVRHLGIPDRLTDLGVSKNDLDDLVKAGMEVTRLLNNNVRTVTEADARAIYLSLL